MSNLYKLWSIQVQPDNARIINSDAVATELLQKTAKPVKMASTPGEDGFAEGLFQENAENVIKVEPDVDHVQLAREEAKAIVEEAKKQAEELVSKAKEQEAQIVDAAKEEGYKQGQERSAEELAELKNNLESVYADKQEQLEYDYSQKRENMEKELINVITDVFNKVFHIQFDNKKEILLYLINNAILNIEGEKKFRIRVTESNVPFLENQKEEILDRVGHDVELEIMADFSMDGNACIIETDSGVFDCSIGVQLENLIKDIRSLCS